MDLSRLVKDSYFTFIKTSEINQIKYFTIAHRIATTALVNSDATKSFINTLKANNTFSTVLIET